MADDETTGWIVVAVLPMGDSEPIRHLYFAANPDPQQAMDAVRAYGAFDDGVSLHAVDKLPSDVIAALAANHGLVMGGVMPAIENL